MLKAMLTIFITATATSHALATDAAGKEMSVKVLAYRVVVWQHNRKTGCYGDGGLDGLAKIKLDQDCDKATAPPYGVRYSVMKVYDWVESDGMIYELTCGTNVGALFVRCGLLPVGHKFPAQVNGKQMSITHQEGNKGKEAVFKFSILDTRPKQ